MKGNNKTKATHKTTKRPPTFGAMAARFWEMVDALKGDTPRDEALKNDTLVSSALYGLIALYVLEFHIVRNSCS